MAKWPKIKVFKSRYFVPDLSPEGRPELANLKPQIVFVAESPFESEVAPEACLVRRPLCGKAGQDWWRMVGQIVANETSTVTTLERLLNLCRTARIAVMNSVQYPLDPKIVSYYGPEADPLAALGFTKVPPASYKKLRTSDDVQSAICNLRERLVHPSVIHLPVVSLGNDSQWFVSQALEAPRGIGRHIDTVPHPSAWWRAGGKFRDKARGQLETLLRQGYVCKDLPHASL